MWLLPSRGRVKNLSRFFLEFANTGANSPGVVRLDHDDPCLNDYLYDIPLPQNWAILVGERKPMHEMYNEFFDDYRTAEWFGFLGDDVIPRTHGWDQDLIQAAGNDGLAFCEDGLNGFDLATHFVLGGDFVREHGWLLLPGLDRLYGDTVWNTLAKEQGVYRYLPNHVLEHMHFSNGKAPKDETYRKPSGRNDEKVFKEWLSNR